MNKLIITLTATLLFFHPVGTFAEQMTVGDFSSLVPTEGLPDHWEPLAFPKIERHTAYSLVEDDGRTVVRAFSDASASGLIRYSKIAVQQYPWIAWRWKISHVLDKGDVYSKKGDDYAARIYVAFEFSPEGVSLWQRLRYNTANLAAGGKLPGSALNYIWANKAPEGTVVSNPYTDQTKMIVLQSGNIEAGQWISEKRNIAEDYEAAFGRKPPLIMGIAIMTDTDNTGESTTAYYGDIRLMDK